METRPNGRSNRCLATGLERPEGLCQPPWNLLGRVLAKAQKDRPEINQSSTGGSNLAYSTMVPNHVGSPDGLSKENSSRGEHSAGDDGIRVSCSNPPASRVAYLRQNFKTEKEAPLGIMAIKILSRMTQCSKNGLAGKKQDRSRFLICE